MHKFKIDYYVLTLQKNSKCSITVRLLNKMLYCGHKPKDFRISGSASLISKSLIYAVPAVGGITPVSIENVVLFPAPLWPSKAVT